jgi:hypothetical protein
MHYALSIRRTASETGSQTALKGEKREGKRANFIRRELARMGLAKPAARRGRVIPFRDVLKGVWFCEAKDGFGQRRFFTP